MSRAFLPPQNRQGTIDELFVPDHEDDRAETREAIDASVQNKTAYDIVYRTVHPNTGEVKWIRAARPAPIPLRMAPGAL